MVDSDPSTELADLLDRLPAGRTVGLAEHDLTVDQLAEGEIVLGVGLADSAHATRLVQAAGQARAAAVVLPGPPRAGLTELAGRAGVELHWLPAGASWRELHQRLSARLSPPAVRGDDELADLAQTIAVLTGGLVTIEDTSARVLAYSRSSDEVDELRRLSILGRSGPPDYLALLREWGVYDRLASSEEVVEIAEHPDSGVRRRLAVGVFAGDRQLGTIWVQQGSADFGPHAEQALLGAARLTAVQLASQGPPAFRRRTGDGLGALLSGRGDTIAGLARQARKPCAVAVVTLGPAERDPAAARLQLDELAAIVTVHATALRRDAVVDQLAGRIYALLPNLDSTDPALGMLTGVVTAGRQHLDPQVRAAVGARVSSVAAAARSSRTAELALTADSAEPVVDFEAVRARLVSIAAENAVAQQAELLDSRIETLVREDPDSARTLLGYLDTGSDVARVAAELGVHPTTVRYRLRRTASTLEIRLGDAEDRLCTQLQLRCGLRGAAKER